MEEKKMAKSKEYKMSVGLSGVALVVLCVGLVAGLMSGVDPLIEKICLSLGISLNLFGILAYMRSKEHNEKQLEK